MNRFLGFVAIRVDGIPTIPIGMITSEAERRASSSSTSGNFSY